MNEENARDSVDVKTRLLSCRFQLLKLFTMEYDLNLILTDLSFVIPSAVYILKYNTFYVKSRKVSYRFRSRFHVVSSEVSRGNKRNVHETDQGANGTSSTRLERTEGRAGTRDNKEMRRFRENIPVHVRGYENEL